MPKNKEDLPIFFMLTSTMIHFVILFEKMYERGKLFRTLKMASVVKPFLLNATLECGRIPI